MALVRGAPPGWPASPFPTAGSYLDPDAMPMPYDTPRRLFLLQTAGLMLALAGCGPKAEPAASRFKNLHGMDFSDQDVRRNFALTDPQGRTRTLTDYRGKVVMVFFGFTQCPDVCPTALYRATQIRKALGKDGEQLQVIFITVDPERDTPEVLDKYVAAFDPGFVALYGTPEQTAATARNFNVFYQKVPTGSSYTMDHTALSFVFDRHGKLQLALQHSQSVDECVDDLRQVFALA